MLFVSFSLSLSMFVPCFFFFSFGLVIGCIGSNVERFPIILQNIQKKNKNERNKKKLYVRNLPEVTILTRFRIRENRKSSK